MRTRTRDSSRTIRCASRPPAVFVSQPQSQPGTRPDRRVIRGIADRAQQCPTPRAAPPATCSCDPRTAQARQAEFVRRELVGGKQHSGPPGAGGGPPETTLHPAPAADSGPWCPPLLAARRLHPCTGHPTNARRTDDVVWVVRGFFAAFSAVCSLPLPYPPAPANVQPPVLAAPPPLAPNVHGFGSPAPGAKIRPQGPRDFANPSHFRYRPKVLTVPTRLHPRCRGTGRTAPSSTATSVMMSPPYQTEQQLATALPGSYYPGAAPPAPLHPSASPYQTHWKPFTPEPPPPSQLYQQQQTQPLLPPPQHQHQQQQGWQRGHQYSRSEPPMIEFPPPSLMIPRQARKTGIIRMLGGPVQRCRSTRARWWEGVAATIVCSAACSGEAAPAESTRTRQEHERSGPAKMSASTVARMLQAQRGNPANASSTSLNKLPANLRARRRLFNRLRLNPKLSRRPRSEDQHPQAGFACHPYAC
jgi:hypothetical protein